jgi:hypothetical protein
MEDGRWEMEDGRWEMEDGRWEMEECKAAIKCALLRWFSTKPSFK